MSLDLLKHYLSVFEHGARIYNHIRAVLKVGNHAAPELNKDDVLLQLCYELPPDVLYMTEHLRGVTANFRLIRDFLSYKGKSCLKYPG